LLPLWVPEGQGEFVNFLIGVALVFCMICLWDIRDELKEIKKILKKKK
jgi:hypothetical protein